MLQSLRTRLALLFAGTLLLATVIATAASIRLYQSYNRDQTVKELRAQVPAVAAYYRHAYLLTFGTHRRQASAPPSPIAASTLEHISGARLYYTGAPLFANAPNNMRRAGVKGLDPTRMKAGSERVVEFVPPGDSRKFIGVATPVVVQTQPIGAFLLAKPLADINNAWTHVAARVAAGTGIGLLVAFILATIFSRRIVRPLRTIGDAADRVAHGDLDVNVVDSHTSDDELGTLATRFQEMVDRLREVDELERNFLMRVSHELRTPLTAISGHVQAISEGLVEPEELDDSLNAVGEEVRRLDRLVGDLLDLTRLEAHRFRLVREEVGLQALLDQAAASFREKARANEIDFEVVTATAPTVLTDGDRVLQIVNNLLDNAFRWTPRGGTVVLSCSALNGTASISVTDTGPGIAKSDQEAVFHPFYSRRGEGGTGLGLAIARELANALGGRLSVDSERGQGATFMLALPKDGSRQPVGAAR